MVQDLCKTIRHTYSLAIFPERYEAFTEFVQREFPGTHLEHVSEDALREILQKDGIISHKHSFYKFPSSPKNTYIYATFPDNNTPEGREQHLQRIKLRMNLQAYLHKNRNIIQKILIK